MTLTQIFHKLSDNLTQNLTQLIFSVFLLFISSNPLFSETKGKLEVAASYVHIDLIQSGITMKDIDMPAIRVEGAWNMGKGMYIKPFGMWGKKDESELITAGACLGVCIPLGKCFLVSPSVGANYTRLDTTIDLLFGDGSFFTFDETFDGWAPYIGLEITYRLRSNLRLSLSGQYAWSRSETEIKDLLKATSDSRGPAYAAMIEYDFSDFWSVNFATAYNESYSREKNGIRGRGGKIGLVRWF